MTAGTILSRTIGETASGTAYTCYTVSFSGRSASVYEPAPIERYQVAPLVLLVHGMIGDHTWVERGVGLELRDPLLDAGHIVASASHGNSWGNQQVMDDLAALYDWMARRWWISSVALVGFSMGGMAVTVAAARQPVPDLVGTVSVNGMIDAHTFHDGTTLTAYGASSWEELPAAMVGHDPANDPAENWAGQEMLFIASSADGSQPMAEAFVARAATPQLIETRYGTHGHLSNPFAGDAVEFVTDRIVPYDPDQAEPTHYPVPAWPDAPEPSPIGGGSPGSGLYRTNGTPVALYTTEGAAVRIGRAG